jgi:hypothetical protein
MCHLEFVTPILEGQPEGTTLVFEPTEHAFFLQIRDEAVKIVKAVFYNAWNTVENKKTETITSQRLKKAAIEMLEKEKTEATTMQIDAEPSADPKIIRDLITEGIKKATADLQKEMNKLHQSVSRSNPSKNSNRGASSPSSTSSASSKKKKEAGPGKGEKKENNNAKGKGKKQPNANRPQTPRKKPESSPGRNAKDSRNDNENKKKQPTGGQRQQQQKEKKKPNKKRSS